jgi:hypothetical protein
LFISLTPNETNFNEENLVESFYIEKISFYKKYVNENRVIVTPESYGEEVANVATNNYYRYFEASQVSLSNDFTIN